MLAAHKARKFLTNYELVCYEKNDSVGGTWVSCLDSLSWNYLNANTSSTKIATQVR